MTFYEAIKIARKELWEKAKNMPTEAYDTLALLHKIIYQNPIIEQAGEIERQKLNHKFHGEA